MDVSNLAYDAAGRGFGSLLDRIRSRSNNILLNIAILTGRVLAMFSTRKDAQRDYESREARFLAIVKHTDPIISRICFGYARTRQEFEDLRQDVLINLWKGSANFRGDSEVSTWVYRVALNTCVSTLRSRSRELTTVQLDSLYEVIDQPDDHLEMIRELHDRIARLSPTDKAIVLLWLDEVSYDEIASMTGLPRNTVATRLRRAKEKLHLMEN